MTSIALPTAPTPAKAGAEFSMLLYGAPKIGKSTFAANLPGALFVATERGLDHLSCFRIPADRPCVGTWEEFRAACKLIADGSHPFKTVVIDTVDNAYALCQTHVLGKNKVEHESDLGYGKGYALVNNEFTRVFNKLASLPYGLCLISHSKTVEEESRTGKRTRIVPTLSGKPRDYVLGLVDLVLYAEIEPERTDKGVIHKRQLKTKPTDEYDAGDRTGKLPEAMELDAAAFVRNFTEAKK